MFSGSRMGERFQNLCLDDKIRLQTLIRELASATQAVQEKENIIKDLENKLKIEETSKAESESHRKGKKIRIQIISF